MRISQGVEWVLHGCVNLSWLPAGTAVPAGRLAELNDLPAPYLNKQFQALVHAGVVESRRGPGGGFALARPADEITVLDVVEAIEGSEPAFRCLEIRQRGPLAASKRDCRAPCQIARVMASADTAWRAALTATTIADIADDVARTTPATRDKIRRWLVKT